MPARGGGAQGAPVALGRKRGAIDKGKDDSSREFKRKKSARSDAGAQDEEAAAAALRGGGVVGRGAT